MRSIVWSALVAVFVVLWVAGVTAVARGNASPETVRFYDDGGRLVVEKGQARDGLSFVRHYFHVDQSEAKGGKGKPGGGSDSPGTDCSAANNRVAAWKWSEPYSATASQHAAIFQWAGEVWDASTTADVFGSVSFGVDYVACVQDFHNQLDFVDLGASSSIAVTTTWYYSFSGEAVESDAQYNTYYSWSTSGAAGAMDVANIGTHKMGHKLGLDHPNGNPSRFRA